jgi:hypothetical protein
MKKIAPLLFSAAAAALLFAGCASGGASAPRNTMKYDLENHSKFVLLDSRVQRSVTCTGLQERIREDKRLEVVANVRNRESRRIEVQINCIFKDAQGFAVDETPFKTLILTENAQESVQFVSMNDKASTYTVRVREAH